MALVLVSLGIQSSPAAGQAGNGKIVFVHAPLCLMVVPTCLVRGYGDLYVVDPDGGGRSELRALPNHVEPRSPAWSPDGTEVAYAAGDRTDELRVLTVATGAERVIFKGFGWIDRIGWAPDGERLVFAGIPVFGSPSIYIVAAEGGDPRLVATEVTAPAWSPDCDGLAFTAWRTGELVVSDTFGNGRRILDHGDSPDWSPDGRTLVYSAYVNDDSWVTVRDVAGGKPRRLALGEDPAWSPDGRQIVFEAWSRAGPPWDLAVMDADGSNVRLITTDLGSAHNRDPDWQPSAARPPARRCATTSPRPHRHRHRHGRRAHNHAHDHRTHHVRRPGSG